MKGAPAPASLAQQSTRGREARISGVGRLSSALQPVRPADDGGHAKSPEGSAVRAAGPTVCNLAFFLMGATMRGRKPTPTVLRLIKGNPRHRPVNRAEAVPPAGMPSVPEHLSDEARLEWDRVCVDLYDSGLLSKVDRAALALYCQAYGRWAAAEQELAAGGLTVTTKSGNTIQNPLLGVARRAAHDVGRFAAELGMSPSARSRVTARPPAREDDPAAKYLRRR